VGEIIVQQHRHRLEIIADVLSTIITFSGEGGGSGGASRSLLMMRSNLSSHGLKEVLDELVLAGFITEKQEGGHLRYVVTETGCEYLAHYRKFEDFAGQYGLRVQLR
jgi:predicted transcriptional regulator